MNANVTSIQHDMASIQHDMARLHDDVVTQVGQAGLIQIVNEESLVIASTMLVELNNAKKKVKERMDFFTKPIKAHVKVIDGFFKTMLDPIERVDGELRTKIVKYRTDQRELQQILVEEARENGGDQPIAIYQPKSARVEGGQITASTRWDFEITDVDKVPESVLREVINTTKGRDALESVIRAKVKAGTREIPGVRVYETEQLSVRQ